MNPTLIRKKMEQQDLYDKVIGGVCGFFGGMIAFVKVCFLDASYWESLAKASGTALLCGFFGVGGKYLFGIAQKAWRRYKTR